MSLNNSNSPMDAEPEDVREAEPSEMAEEAQETDGSPLHHMTDKPGSEGGTAG